MAYLFHELTELMIKELNQHHAVNLCGFAEYGRERVLQDIKSYPPDNTLVLLVNMKTCRNRYVSFLQAMSAQAGSQNITAQSWGDIVNALEQQPKQVFLLLENFDALMDTVELDAAYQLDFLDNLNALKNRGRIQLVCATRERYNQSSFYLGQHAGPSNLDIPTRIEIKKHHFGQKKILATLSEINQKLSKKAQQVLCVYIEKHMYPYAFLVHIKPDLACLEQIDDDGLTEWIEQWKNSFKQNTKTPLTHWIDKIVSKLAYAAQFLFFQVKKLRFVLPLINSLKGLKDSLWKNNKN
ncbi:hypothetical protein BegalDRAFT_0117 [Beggiatoa alba B18LD]|uniref:Uncharacterized protein n=1 Tax=Beggiatoa alba B18LD TaxID=395493 RepID=I3CBP8_9GAMM|nr:hypothetical protein [Beggiatoa alba]EIJ41041.1 hypothetical protein BegalDRAFT_0117 [Beggiatoa alba B18LD]